MERKVMQMLDKIEVPAETAARAEELLMKELVNNNDRKGEENDMRTKVQLQNRNRKAVKVMGGFAAAVVLVAGIGVAVSTFGGDNKNEYILAATDPATNTPTSDAPATIAPTADASTTDAPTTPEASHAAKLDETLKTLQERKAVALKVGTNQIDLDLDGTKEKVVLKMTDTGTSMQDYEISVGDQVIKGDVDRDEGLKLRAMMLSEEKESVQLVFTHQYSSDDYLTDVYNYEDGKLVKVGVFADEVDKIAIKKDGSFDIYQPKGVLGLWKHSTVKMTANTKKDKEITGKYCLVETDKIEKTMEFKYDVQALQRVSLYKDMDTKSGKIASFASGEKGKTLKVLDGKWLYIENSKGQKGYLEIKDEDIILNGTAIKGWQVFGGLPFAG